MKFKNPIPFPSFISIILLTGLLSGCFRDRFVVVEGYPEQAVRQTDLDPIEELNTIPLTLRYGELNPIRNLDPLFANNDASQRLIMLIYEGLVRLDENGVIMPALAQSWLVSDDSLEITFTLRNDIYFQDNPAFNNGLGRKINAFDIERVFIRMAELEVPPTAANLFRETIRGFDAFFTERHEVFEAEQRRISRISGINATGENAVRFTLARKDPLFLEKLASPYAVVYPVEFLDQPDINLSKTPVGSGPFALSAAYNDTLFVLERNRNFTSRGGVNIPKLDRLEIINNGNETDVYKRFVTGKIQFIPELGPLMIKSVITDSATLQAGFEGNYQLAVKQGHDFIDLAFNPGNYQSLDRHDALSLLSTVDWPSVKRNMGMSTFEIEHLNSLSGISTLEKMVGLFNSGVGGQRNLLLSFTDDQVSRLLGRFVGSEINKAIPVQLVQSQIVSRDIFLYIKRIPAYTSQPGLGVATDLRLARFNVRHFALWNNEIDGVELNNYSWWIDLSNVSLKPRTAQL